MIEILVFFILSVVIGLMFVFFGYPFFRVLLPLWAFFVGIAFGMNGITGLMGAGFITVTLGLVIGVVIGAVFAAIAYYVYSLAVYLFGITVGYTLGYGLMMAIGAGSFLSVIVGLALAVLFLLLFIFAQMQKLFIVVLTAAAGSMAVIMGLLVLFGQVPEVFASLQLTTLIVSNSWFWVIVWAVLALLGMGFQYVVLTVFDQVELMEEYSWEKDYTRKRKRK